MLETAIVGAGPYGLSIGAHLRGQGLSFRIFGRPMDTWREHMPVGMMLKSDGFASNIFDPEGACTLKGFCAEKGFPYADMGVPVSLEVFNAYGVTFAQRMLPELEEKRVEWVDRTSSGFVVRLEDGEIVDARNVVLAVGITHFDTIPESLAGLPEPYVTHSSAHREVAPFKGRRVAIIGGGASALDLAGLLHEAGAHVQIISRGPEIKFHNPPTGKAPSFWANLTRPASGLGPGWRTRFFADAPWAFHLLPEHKRIRVVQRALGPSGGYFIKNKVVGRIPMLLGLEIAQAKIKDGGVCLNLRGPEGSQKEVSVQHVIAATGYAVDVERLKILSPQLRSEVKTAKGSPVLSSSFESSVRGLYFVGVAAANSFGPVMRFAYGADYTARKLSTTLTKSGRREHIAAATQGIPSVAK
jgi:hypothetical protein